MSIPISFQLFLWSFHAAVCLSRTMFQQFRCICCFSTTTTHEKGEYVSHLGKGKWEIQTRKIIRSCSLSGRRSAPSKSIEALVGVSDKRKRHARVLAAGSLRLSAKLGAGVGLGDFVDREVLCIDGRLELGLEGSTNAAQLIPGDATEEGVLLQLFGTTVATKTVFCVTDEAIPKLVCENKILESKTYLLMKFSASEPIC